MADEDPPGEVVNESLGKKVIKGSLTVSGLLQGAAAVVVIVPGVLAAIHFFGPSADSAPPPPSAAQTLPAASSETAGSPSTECWDGDAKPIDCALDHRYQAIPTAIAGDGLCTREAALTWLGYDAGIDVVGFDLETNLASPRCVVDGGSLKRGDFGDALGADDSGQWRLCADGDIRDPKTLKPAGCREPHVAEYVGASVSGVATLEECKVAARSFVGRADLDGLTVYPLARVEAGLATPRCMVAVTTGRPLIDTLRRLENANLPRES